MTSNIFRLLYFLRVHKILHFLIPADKIIVLCLHEIVTNSTTKNPIELNVFEQLLRYLVDNFDVITFNDIEKLKTYKQTKKRKIILSFDDGHISFMENVLPLLLKYNIKVNHNIVYNCMIGQEIIWSDKLNNILDVISKMKYYQIDVQGETFSFGINENNKKSSVKLLKCIMSLTHEVKTEILDEHSRKLNLRYDIEYMNSHHLKQIKNNIEIGSHSMNHINFNQSEKKDSLIQNFIDSKFKLEKNLETKINIFALPNGITSHEINLLLKKLNIYDYILTTEPKIWNPNENNLVPRICLYKKSYYELIFQLYNVFNKMNTFRSIFLK